MTEKEYLDWLNADPKEIKQNPDGSDYVPISIVQQDLFEGYAGNTKFELLRESLMKSGMIGIGRLHYKNPITNEWLFQDGSASIQHRNGMRLDFPALAGHVMLSCAKKIGRRFGRELNRDKEDSPIEPLTEEGQQSSTTDKEFAIVKKKVIAAKTKESAEEIVLKHGFRLNIELMTIANSKPSKNK